MSRSYNMAFTVPIHGLSADEVNQISSAIHELWNIDSSNMDAEEQQLNLCGEGSLAGGESDNEFANRVFHAVWKELNKFIPIRVEATYLEDLPFELFEAEITDYQTWITQK